MSYTESIENLLEEIELHEAPLAEAESFFLERVTARFEDEGTLDSDSVAELYELLDKLDNRAGSSSYSYSYAGSYDDEDEYDFYRSYSEEEEEEEEEEE